MATTKDYLDFVCTQLEGIRGVDYKRMFGEYQTTSMISPFCWPATIQYL